MKYTIQGDVLVARDHQEAAATLEKLLADGLFSPQEVDLDVFSDEEDILSVWANRRELTQDKIDVIEGLLLSLRPLAVEPGVFNCAIDCGLYTLYVLPTSGGFHVRRPGRYGDLGCQKS